MWSALRATSRALRGLAFGFVIVLVAAGVVVTLPEAQAGSGGDVPRDALTVTISTDRGSYVSGDNATATAIVYRTPGPAAYNYTWEVEDLFGNPLASLANGTSTYAYPIPLTFEGLIRFRVTVDDDRGLSNVATREAGVAAGYVGIILDRSEYNPGDRINAFLSLRSRVITKPSYAYDVTDQAGTTVLANQTNDTSFSFLTPDPASSLYAFSVTASESGRSAESTLTIFRAGGYVLSLSVDRDTYSPGGTIRVHLTITARGTSSLPSQLRFSVGLVGATSASSISTSPSVDVFVTVPGGMATGDAILVATELTTFVSAFKIIHIGPETTFWSTEIGGIPAYGVVLGFLFLFLLVAVLALWRRLGGGTFRAPGGPPGAVMPPPEGPVRAPPTSPMSVACRHCGKAIDITTSKRPIEVMCPSCGETQLVT